MKTKTVLGYVVKDCPIQSKEAADSPAKVLAYLDFIRKADREHFVALYMNARNQVIAVDTISIGTLSASLVHPREVFKGALLFNAAAVVVAHNHPSGDSTPSAEDKSTTSRLVRAGELLGVPLLDHLVVVQESHFSFKEAGLI